MKFFITLLTLLFAHSVMAENTTIDMLNKLEKRNMVFSKEIVKIDVGDTVFWKSIDKGHNVQFISLHIYGTQITNQKINPNLYL